MKGKLYIFALSAFIIFGSSSVIAQDLEQLACSNAARTRFNDCKNVCNTQKIDDKLACGVNPLCRKTCETAKEACLAPYETQLDACIAAVDTILESAKDQCKLTLGCGSTCWTNPDFLNCIRPASLARYNSKLDCKDGLRLDAQAQQAIRNCKDVAKICRKTCKLSAVEPTPVVVLTPVL